MIMTRNKKAAAKSAGVTNAPKLPQLQEFIQKRDYTGALTLLEFNIRSDEMEDSAKQQTLMWIGYCAFHMGDFNKSLAAYTDVWDGQDPPQETHLYIACCQYYLQMYSEAEEEASQGPNCPLRTRILFHVAHKTNNEQKLMEYHQQLSDTKEDQLCLAAIHYVRNHYQEATDIYKRMLLENRDDLALNVYVAMCYYKLDYYDVSLEILAIYLQSFPDSAVAINLKACNHFRLYNGTAAESELKVLSDQGVNLNDNDLVKHNLVVFLKGERALQVLPGMVDFVPEAKLNLVIYHLRQDQITEAYDLIKDLEPSTPPEYILKGIVNACVGQRNSSREHLKTAQQLFQLVGASASESDTIPGRQCMASCFFLLKQFEDVNIYLNSIKAYLYNDDHFNWNFGISSASVGNFKVGEETLLLVQDENYKKDYTYISWLARCYINNGNARAAWDLYLKMETVNDSNAVNLIQLIANDCYKTGAFYYAAKGFDILERHDPDPEFWEGKRGACVGVFQMVVAGKERAENLVEVVNMLRATTNPQVEYIIRTITTWCSSNGIGIE
jgi:intraflagellar transport protein 56